MGCAGTVSCVQTDSNTRNGKGKWGTYSCVHTMFKNNEFKLGYVSSLYRLLKILKNRNGKNTV